MFWLPDEIETRHLTLLSALVCFPQGKQLLCARLCKSVLIKKMNLKDVTLTIPVVVKEAATGAVSPKVRWEAV